MAQRGHINSRTPFLPGQILVRYQRPKETARLTEQLTDGEAFVSRLPSTPISPALLQVSGLSNLSPEEAKQKTVDLIQRLVASPEVIYAEPNYLYGTPVLRSTRTTEVAE